MNPATRTIKALAATALAVPAVTRAAWKAAAWPAGNASPYSLVEGWRTFGRAWAGGISLVWSSWMGADYARLVRLAFSNPVAGRGLRLVAQTMADAPVYVESRTRDGAWEQADGYGAVLDLMDRPNDRTTRESAMLAIVTALYCGGEFWVDLVDAPMTGANAGRPRSMRYIMPDEFVGFLRGEADEITGYRFRSRPGNGRTARTYTRSTAECRHVRLFHPTDEDRGLPILVSAAAEIEGMHNATAWNASLSKGGGSIGTVWRPTAAVTGEAGQLTKEQRDVAQASLDELLNDAIATGRDRVIAGGLERVPGDATPRDADWSKAMAGYIRMIAAVIGVPATLIGDEKAGSLTDAGVDSEVAALYKLTVLPLLRFVLAEFAAMLLPPGTRFAVDTDQIEALGEDMDAKAARYVSLTAGPDAPLSRNEGRVALGYDRLTPDGTEWTEGTVTAFDIPGGGPREAPPPMEAPDDEEDTPPFKALGSLSGDGFDSLLQLIPQAA